MLEFFLTKGAEGAWESQVHAFAFDGDYLLFDVNSASLHLLDTPAWEVAGAFSVAKGRAEVFWEQLTAWPRDVVEGVIDEFARLVEEKTLFSPDPMEGETLAPYFDGVLKSLCLNISHDCNLACGYCFAGKGDFGGPRDQMDVETGQKALDYLLDHAGERPTCEVDFFGGEPLMNWEVVKALVAYGKEEAAKRGKTFRFTLTTNGVLLDEEKQAFLNANGISVVLSLDGRKEVHDQMRPNLAGRGSYDRVLPRFQSLVGSRGGKNYYLRGTFTRYNLDFAEDVRHMAELGFQEISLEPVVADPKEPYAFTEADQEKIKEGYTALAQIWQQRRKENRPFTFFHFQVDLQGGPCVVKRLTGCGAGYQYLAVTPKGELYPCHQFVGKEEYLLGTLAEGINRPELVQAFKDAHIYNKSCKTCWARFLCSGGCHANAVNHNGSLLEPYEMGCFLQKVRLETAIGLYVKTSQEENH